MSAIPSLLSAPVVVDSPLPQTPGATIPVPAGQQPFTAAPEQTVPGTAAEPVNTPDDVTRMGQTLGLDLTAFPTPESKRAAVQWAIERYAATGFNVNPADAGQPATPANTPLEEDDDEGNADVTEFDAAIGITGITDPKVAKQIKALEKRLQKAETENRRIQETFQQQQQAVYEGQVAELTRRTEAAIDKMASAKYGVGGQKTFGQQVSRENLKRLAGSIIYGLQNQPGQTIPVIEEIVALAAFYDNGGQLPQAPQQAQANPMAALMSSLGIPQTQSQPQAAPVQTAFGRPIQPAQAAPARPIVNEKDYYLKDPQYMAGAKAIMNRGR